MKCANCGCELPEGSKFCFNCGAKQPEQPAPVYEPEVKTEDVSEVKETESVQQPENIESSQKPEVKEDGHNAQEEAVIQNQPEAEKEPEVPAWDDRNVVQEENTAQEGDYKFCPYCGARNDGDAVFCCSCGNNMNMEEDTSGSDVSEEVRKKRVPVKLIAGIAVAVVVVVGGFQLVKGLTGGEKDYVFYLKNRRVTQTDLDHYKKDPVMYSGDFGADNAEYGAKVAYSDDGKYICYPTDMDYGNDGMEFRLNMQKIGKTEDPVKIDSSVKRYDLLKNNKVVYIKSGSDVLYLNDRKGNKEKIASDVVNYYIDEDEKNIVWAEDSGDKYDICQQDLALKKDKKVLIKDVTNYNITKNMKQIAVMDEDTLYLVKDFGEKEKIASGVQNILSNNEESGVVFYVKTAEDVLVAADLVEDDCADSDKTMEEPQYEDFKTEKVEKNSYTGKYEKTEVVDYDAYDEAYDAYRAKARRDEMREYLDEEEVSSQNRELYCYKDGKEEMIDAAYADNCSYGDSKELIFNSYNTEEVPKIKLSEIEYLDEVEGKYQESLEKAKQTCVYTGSKVITLNEVLNGSFTIDSKEKTGYGIRYTGEEDVKATLFSFSVDSKSDGKCKEVSADVGNVEFAKDGKVYYLADADSGSGDLYCNDKNIDSDVQAYTVQSVGDSIVYAVDYDRSKARATLKVYDGKDDKTVADDVFGYKAFDDDKIAVLTDYDLERAEGELKFYRGKDELIDLDDDVSMIFGERNFYNY